MRDGSVVTRTVTRQESSHSGVFPFLISDSRAWEEQEGVEANHEHEMTVSLHSKSRCLCVVLLFLLRLVLVLE